MTTAIVLAMLLAAAHLVVIFGFVIVEGREPAATFAWLMMLLFVPGLGILLYLWLGRLRVRRRSQEAQRVADQAYGDLAQDPDEVVVDPARHPHERTRALLTLAQRVGNNRATAGNRAVLLINAEVTYDAMRAAIEEARHHVHVLFYIFQPDETGRRLREHLVAAAARGVEVRVIVDAVGSLWLPDGFWRELEEAGGHAAVFSPVSPWVRLRRRDRVDFRNHRKIVVVDGRVGFTGGINVGREYLGLNPALGRWRDTHIRLEGPAVRQLQRTFRRDWLDAAGEKLDVHRYFPSPPLATPGEDTVLVVPSGPDDPWQPLQRIYQQAIALARERVWITSPYFVPDRVTEEMLVTAALRGVDVKVLLPSRSDQRIALMAGRAYYPALLEAGVEVYEYERGFMHAKTLVVDRWIGTVGSANMDIRSFQLNFELNAFVLGERLTRELAEQFLVDLQHAGPVLHEDVKRLPYVARLTRAAARLLSPLL